MLNRFKIIFYIGFRVLLSPPLKILALQGMVCIVDNIVECSDLGIPSSILVKFIIPSIIVLLQVFFIIVLTVINNDFRM